MDYNDHDAKPKGKSNFLGLLLLFLVLTILGSLLSFIYIIILDGLSSVWLSLLAAVFLGFLLSKIVGSLTKKFKITSKIGIVITVLISLLLINYFKWCCFFGLNYLRFFYWDYGYDFEPFIDVFYNFPDVISSIAFELKDPMYFMTSVLDFNYYGTWGYGDNIITGGLLWIIWLGELLIINVPAIKACSAYDMPYDASAKQWASPVFMNIPFERFTKDEYKNIKEGDTRTILYKQKAENVSSGKCSYITIYKINNENTGHLAIFDYNNKNGKKKKMGDTMFLGKELINDLEKKLNDQLSVSVPAEEIKEPDVEEVPLEENSTENDNSN